MFSLVIIRLFSPLKQSLLFSFILLFCTQCSLWGPSDNDPLDLDRMSDTNSSSKNNIQAAVDPTTLPQYIPDHLKASELGGTQRSNSLEGQLALAKEQGIIMTDPDDPYKVIPELDKALRMRKSVDWETNYVEAKQIALREQKPLLIWFTDSKSSPICSKLSAEFLAVPEFADWASENIIRLKLDQSMRLKERSASIKRENQLKKLADKYNARGKPTLVILTADGQVVDTLKGYVSGTQETLKKTLVNDLRVAVKRFKETKEKLRAQGFRDWTSRNGKNKLFAKLYNYQNSGNMRLQEPNGNILPAHIKYFSPQDVSWIEQEKKKIPQ